MKANHLLSLVLALTIAAPATLALAAQDEEHAGHHPAPAVPAAGSKAVPGKSAAAMGQMDDQTKAMALMHEKMLAAKTPEERNALMAEHMKAMQDGMSMMNGMSSGGMGGMKGDMAARQQMMEKHMAMMGATMQMMMDRLPTPPAK
jgi:hypothetical protein